MSPIIYRDFTADAEFTITEFRSKFRPWDEFAVRSSGRKMNCGCNHLTAPGWWSSIATMCAGYPPCLIATLAIGWRYKAVTHAHHLLGVEYCTKTHVS